MILSSWSPVTLARTIIIAHFLYNINTVSYTAVLFIFVKWLLMKKQEIIKSMKLMNYTQIKLPKVRDNMKIPENPPIPS